MKRVLMTWVKGAAFAVLALGAVACNDDDDDDKDDDDNDDILAYAGIENIGGVNTVVFATNENISLAKGKTIKLVEENNFSIKVANSNDLRFFVSTTKQSASANSGRGGRGETTEESASGDSKDSSEKPSSSEDGSGDSSESRNGSGSTAAPSPYGLWTAIGSISVVLCVVVGRSWMKNKK